MDNLLSINDLSLERAALAYASMGIPVLPLLPFNKQPFGKIVPHGLIDASTDIGTVRTWWEKYPLANIGLRTGVLFDVVDLDGPVALESLKQLAPGYKHSGPVSSTGKGFHLLFQPTGERNTAAKLPGIDFRGLAGYIIASPSIHPNGSKYQWAREGELSVAPDWVYTITAPPAQVSVDREQLDLEPIIGKWMDTFGSFTDQAPLVATGRNYTTQCPWHDDSTPSLVLYPHNDSFYCFGCTRWGDTINLAWAWKEEEPPHAVGETS